MRRDKSEGGERGERMRTRMGVPLFLRSSHRCPRRPCFPWLSGRETTRSLVHPRWELELWVCAWVPCVRAGGQMEPLRRDPPPPPEPCCCKCSWASADYGICADPVTLLHAVRATGRIAKGSRKGETRRVETSRQTLGRMDGCSAKMDEDSRRHKLRERVGSLSCFAVDNRR